MTTVPETLPARGGSTQELRYFRKVVNFNDANIGSSTAPPKFGRLPAGAFITDVTVEVSTAFNAGTTNVLTVGTSAANANEIVAAADVNEGVVGVTKVTRGLGTSLTGGPGIGANAPPSTSEVDLYVKYTQSGTAATAGVATIVIQYAGNNDR